MKGTAAVIFSAPKRRGGERVQKGKESKRKGGMNFSIFSIRTKGEKKAIDHSVSISDHGKRRIGERNCGRRPQPAADGKKKGGSVAIERKNTREKKGP